MRETQEGCPSPLTSRVFETFSKFQKLTQRGEKTFSTRTPPPGTTPDGGVFFTKSLAEFAARRRQIIEIIFHRDLCVGKNTSQAASVEFCRKAAKLCTQQTASLLAEKTKFFRQFSLWHFGQRCCSPAPQRAPTRCAAAPRPAPSLSPAAPGPVAPSPAWRSRHRSAGAGR